MSLKLAARVRAYAPPRAQLEEGQRRRACALVALD
jgi:hypothetical protein